MNFNPEILGLVAGTLSCITFVPQIFKTWKSKSVKDISVMSFMIVVISTLIWLAYGIIKELPSVILTNVVVCLSAMIMLLLKWKYAEK
jgi:MtN3 and saliva related transmembrane protein